MFGEWMPDERSVSRVLRDLTAEARADRLEPVCCREDEIARVIDILLRQTKNNAALVGPAGVGKTAIAEGLAQRVASGHVPHALREAKVLALDHVALLAGTMFRGQYEERIRSLVEQASRDPNIILFIDELHNLIGQGTAMGAAMDAANMLKPALVRGDFRVIGATTDQEYDRWVRGDPALERRFQRIVIQELSADQSLEVLRVRRDRLERHHGVAISDDALLAAVRLSDLFVKDRARPDRGIDVLDEACAHVQARAVYPEPLAARLAERRTLEREAVAAAREHARQASREPAAGEAEDDPLERFARDGFAALQRFGLELEAAFAGPDARQAPPGPVAGPTPASPEPVRQAEPPAERLRVLEWELRRLLIEAGIVVRGGDVARVVSAASGQRVEWKA
ncbi:MAG TPA: AAA family ATPase [Gemmatimonadaceae bacterium]|nr:AAA family ATPase [Gemmatimonadaceae bacterium]